LEIVITTAGDDKSQLWIEEDAYACKVLTESGEGRHIDDKYFAFVCRVDDEDDPFDEANWIKANPNLGVSVKVDYLRQQANEAKNRPTETNKFVRFHANKRTGSHEVLITRAVWDRGNKPLTIDLGAYGHGGIDIGRNNDWTAASMVFPVGDHWEVISRAWTCRSGDFPVHSEPFRTWINAGLLECCDGNAIDPEAMIRWVVDQSDKYQIRTWAIDPNFAKLIGQQLQNDHGIKVFAFTQSPRFYNEPTRKFELAAKEDKIIHAGDPVLAWQVANMQVMRNAKDEWMPDKGNRESKIDAVVATLMAFSECLFAASQSVDGSLILT
jgi:phage terminase large subunit-like protein